MTGYLFRRQKLQQVIFIGRFRHMYQKGSVILQKPTNFMAFRTAKVLVLLCLVLTVVVTLVVMRSGILNVKVTMQRFLHAPKEKLTATTTVKVNSVLNASQKLKWERCKKLISGEEKLKKRPIVWNDAYIRDKYHPDEDCAHVLETRFVHPPVSKEEKQLPIAFGLTIHRSARLFERILRAIYMPNNVYCIHVDKKSSSVFREAIQAIIRCLSNVFIAANSVDVTWGHITVVQAQFSCMEELLKSTVKWKYYISLVGQDFPLYDNKQIVRALHGLNNTNNIESFPVSNEFLGRTKFVHLLKARQIYRTETPKGPPPHNISVYKGSTFIIAIREFVEFVLCNQIGKDFYEFLRNAEVPDEAIYSSLQRHPQAPGGINGNQPKWIARVLLWATEDTLDVCHGIWIRHVCWISLEDLRWVLGGREKKQLFVNKIPFDFSEELIECILLARQGREYATTVWK